MKERREYIRLGDSLKIMYKIISPPGAQRGGYTEDISGGGIRFSLDHYLKVGTVVELSLSIPEQESPIQATGEVVWLREKKDMKAPYSVGIKFIKIDPFERGKILNYIRRRVTENKPVDIKWID